MISDIRNKLFVYLYVPYKYTWNYLNFIDIIVTLFSNCDIYYNIN